MRRRLLKELKKIKEQYYNLFINTNSDDPIYIRREGGGSSICITPENGLARYYVSEDVENMDALLGFDVPNYGRITAVRLEGTFPKLTSAEQMFFGL